MAMGKGEMTTRKEGTIKKGDRIASFANCDITFESDKRMVAVTGFVGLCSLCLPGRSLR